MKNMIKRIMVLLCCGLLLFSGSSMGYVKAVIDDDDNNSSDVYYSDPVMLAGDTNTPIGRIGEVMKVKLHIVNRGSRDVEDVTITPKVSSKTETFPFEISKANYSMRLNGTTSNPSRDDSVLEAKDDDTVVFTFTVRQDVITGYYPIEYAITYVLDGSFHSTTVTSYVYIEGKPEETETEKTDIQLSLRNSPTLPPATYGQPIYFDLYITNFGKSDATSVTITPEVSEDPAKFPFKVEQTSYEQRLENPLLGTASQPSEEARKQRVHYSWNARTDVKSGYYPVVFHITAKDVNGDEYKVDQTVYFDMNGNPEKDKEAEDATETTGNKSEPRLIVTGYETDKKEIKAGDTFQLTIHIMNTSNRTAVSNIKFTLSSSEDKNDNCFIPMSGSSTIFVQRIGIGETIDLVVDMTAKPTLEAKSYPLTIESKFEDSEITAYTGVESIAIPVTQELRVTVGDIEVMPASIELGSQSNIMFAINNLGKSKIYNVSVAFQGDSITGGDCFLGNLDSGATGNADAMVTGTAATMDEGNITAVISYENEKGEIFTIEKECQLFVSEPFIPEGDMGNGMWDDTMMPIEPEKKGPNWILIGGIAGVAVIGIIIAIVIVVKHKKRKKEEGMDEDEIL